MEEVGLALAAAAPLVRIDGPQRCLIDTATGAGQAVLAATWALQVLVWALLTLFVAGFTGLVRRSP
ncbi:hypothetical protein B0I33_10317 [Prauserella shujinwangii]|uniref:Uncharacterized protein n=1 Tax=Prauserella shujinwangii TaxID=1453103 RepID=A0A2T0LXY4_9PSEU|nr:hypothetical protein [Prauserella shujinwangii]PRX48985.1 hypothetical protein B0I33_10317 [Prauserella shujinwangii]